MKERMVDKSKPNDKSSSATLLPQTISTGELMAYPVAAVAGYSVLDTEIRKASYKNLVTQGLFKDLQLDRRAKYHEIFDHAMQNPGTNTVPAIKDLEIEYRSAVRDRFKAMGLNHTADYWEVLKRNQKQNVAILGATVSGVVLGGLLTMASNKHWWQQFDKLTDKLDSPRER